MRKVYLKKTCVKLNIKKPETINEKIQWLKKYDNPMAKSRLTDKIFVCNRIKDKIKEEDLEPALQMCSSFDEEYNSIKLFKTKEIQIENNEADNLLKQAVELSKKQAEDFRFVQIERFIYKNKLYFEEMTFTLHSAYIDLKDNCTCLKSANILNLQ